MRKLSVISMLLLVLSFSCAQENKANKSEVEVASAPEVSKTVTSVDPNSPQEKFWQRLQEHCGKAYAGVYEDRKSTRLNSSHVAISYAVFCLKNKKQRTDQCAEGVRTT